LSHLGPRRLDAPLYTTVVQEATVGPLADYGRVILFAALRTSSSLSAPVFRRIVSNRVFGPKPGIGSAKFLFNVSPRFLWISPFLSR
jgi:hypothetical protein